MDIIEYYWAVRNYERGNIRETWEGYMNWYRMEWAETGEQFMWYQQHFKEKSLIDFW